MFTQWRIYIVGPLPKGEIQVWFIIVAIDYFTKWVDAEPMTKIAERKVHSFIWRSIICRFGVLEVLISDNGNQFNNPKFREFCSSLEIRNPFSSLGHPQANRQVKVTNRTLMKIIKLS